MTQERFLSFIENPDLLERITYQELKTLTLSYPFSANLRTLLLLKSTQENHREKTFNLSIAALYHPDRAHLFQLMAPKLVITRFQENAVAEEILELKPLAEVGAENFATLAVEPEVEKKLEARSETDFSKKTEPDFSKIEADEPPVFENETPENAPIFSEKKKDASVVRLTDLVEKESGSILASRPMTRLDFLQWLHQFELPILSKKINKPQLADSRFSIEKEVAEKEVEVEFSEKTTTAQPEKPKPKTAKTEAQIEREKAAAVRKLVQESIAEKEEIVSETLAKLYARQGYKDKAIAMYQRLAVAFPEKSATFAAEIEKISL